jgi:hypothetical protein
VLEGPKKLRGTRRQEKGVASSAEKTTWLTSVSQEPPAAAYFPIADPARDLEPYVRFSVVGCEDLTAAHFSRQADTKVVEASGLQIGKCTSQDASTIIVQQTVWSGGVQLPKTKNAPREIDLDSDLADMKLSDDVQFRRECAEKVRLGFAIPAPNAEVVPCVPKSEGLAQIEQALVIQAMMAGCGGPI